jgi:hypothetical protein
MPPFFTPLIASPLPPISIFFVMMITPCHYFAITPRHFDRFSIHIIIDFQPLSPHWPLARYYAT